MPDPLASHIEARDSKEDAAEANDPQRALVTSNEAVEWHLSHCHRGVVHDHVDLRS